MATHTTPGMENYFIDFLDDFKQLLATNMLAPKEILNEEEVLRLLSISKRTLASYREDGTLPFYKVKGKIFYKYSDVLQMIEKHKVENTSSKIRIGKGGSDDKKL